MKDFISEILDRILIAEKEMIDSISSGVNIHSFEAYQRLVGRREGLSDALSIINNILSDSEQAE